MTATLPSPRDLDRLYSRREARACLGWSDDKFKRRLDALPAGAVQPSGKGRGQQFTGADIWALYRGGQACRVGEAKDGSRSTGPATIAAATAGTSAERTSGAARSKGGSRSPSHLHRLLSELPDDFWQNQTVVPLYRR